MAGRKPAAKTAATKVEATETKTENIKAEEKVAEKAAEVKKEPAKKAAAAKTPAAKKETAKKETAGTKKAAKESTLHIQFAGKSYAEDDLVKIAKDVWKYDLKQKAGDLNTVELYVKPEESKVYYVINGEFTGSFAI